MVSHHAFRLRPGQDLKLELEDYANRHRLAAAWIVTCVGSLRQVNLRYANQDAGTQSLGYYEILSLSGTLSIYGSHLHLGVADKKGRCVGGHLLPGNLIYTTAELILAAADDLSFVREIDEVSGYRELVVRRL